MLADMRSRCRAPLIYIGRRNGRSRSPYCRVAVTAALFRHYRAHHGQEEELPNKSPPCRLSKLIYLWQPRITDSRLCWPDASFVIVASRWVHAPFSARRQRSFSDESLTRIGARRSPSLAPLFASYPPGQAINECLRSSMPKAPRCKLKLPGSSDS